MFLENMFQNAYITRDLDKSVAMLRSKYDIQDYIFFSPDMEVTTPKGRGPAVVKVALAWIGRQQIELIEPVSGLVDMYRPYVPTDDSLRFHHVCMRVEDLDKARADVVRENRPVVYEGGVEGVRFFYVDARDTMGHYLEYLWASPEMWREMGWPF